jgi:hypothetical protein
MTEDQSVVPVSRSSSPSVLERHLSTVVADVVLETKNRPSQAGGSQAALSPPEAGADFKTGRGFFPCFLAFFMSHFLHERGEPPLVNTGVLPEEQGSSTMLPQSKRGGGMQTAFLLPG